MDNITKGRWFRDKRKNKIFKFYGFVEERGCKFHCLITDSGLAEYLSYELEEVDGPDGEKLI